MQDRMKIDVEQLSTQIHQQPQPNPLTNYTNASPANSPWLNRIKGSISMQQDIEDSNSNLLNPNGSNDHEPKNILNQNDILNDSDNSNSDDKEDVDRLSSEFSSAFTIFVSIIIVSTMSLLIYSNSQDGAYVQVQVTPLLPSDTSSNSIILSENVTPWSTQHTLFLSESTNNMATMDNNMTNYDEEVDIELMIYNLIIYIEKLHSKYPYLKVLNTHENGIDFEYLYQHRLNISAIISEFELTDLTSSDTYKFDVFSFTLTSSIDDFWAAKAYELAFVIAAFSGAWPYIKLLLLLVIWLHPMKSKQRAKGLLFLDQFGKFSFIDLYVCIFMVVSFYLTISEQMSSGLGVSVAVIVQLDIGVITFAVATLVSMIYSMVFILFDERKRFDQRKKEIQKNECKKYALPVQGNPIDNAPVNIPTIYNVDCFENHIEKHSRLHEWKYDKSYKIYALYDLPQSFIGIIWRCIFLIICIGNIWLCIDTIYTAPVRYNMKGLAGWAIDNNIRSYSLKKTADLLPDSTDATGAAYFCIIQYYMTVIIAPILVSTVIICLWLCPMNYKMHNLICHLLYPLQAWNAMDVFLVGTVAASVELDEVSQWILNTNYPGACGDDGVIQKILHVGCFSVEGNLTPGTVMLGVYVVVEWFTLLYTRIHINNTYKKYAKFDFKEAIN